jgi:hypothetical protein
MLPQMMFVMFVVNLSHQKVGIDATIAKLECMEKLFVQAIP